MVFNSYLVSFVHLKEKMKEIAVPEFIVTSITLPVEKIAECRGERVRMQIEIYV